MFLLLSITVRMGMKDGRHEISEEQGLILMRNMNQPQSLRNYRLHPLIHTLLEFNLPQDIEG